MAIGDTLYVAGAYRYGGYLVTRCSDKRTALVQTDYDWPALARDFGWNIRSVQHDDYKDQPCAHDGTDGTIDCPNCALTAGAFIRAAGEYLGDTPQIEDDDATDTESLDALFNDAGAS